MLSCEICEIFKNTYFYRTPTVAKFLHVKRTFFNVEWEALYLHPLRWRKNIYCGPCCRDDGRRAFLIYESEISVMKKIPFFYEIMMGIKRDPRFLHVIRNLHFNGKNIQTRSRLISCLG